MKISDLLSAIEDDSVPIREKEIIASDRIKEVTMAKLHAENEKLPTMKKRARKGTALVILAAALLALSATALAAGLLNREVRWDGTPVEEPSATPIPTNIPAVSAVAETEQQAMGDILSQNQGKDLIIVRLGDSAGTTERMEKLSTPEELRELLVEKQSVLAVPFQVPEGYRFSRGFVSYSLSVGYAYELLSTEQRERGLTVERYAAPAEGDFISAYTLVFVNDAGDKLSLYGRLTENSESMGFGYSDGDTVRTADVEGMDDALVIEHPEYTSLFLRKALDKPISYVFPLGMVRDPAEPLNEFDGIVYRVTADALDGEEILSSLGF